MTATGEQIARAAATFVGTRFKHLGRRPGHVLDCAGVVLCAWWAAGARVPDFQGYGRTPEPDVLLAELQRHAVAVDLDDVQLGDVLAFARVFACGLRPAHVGIWTGERFVHAHQAAGRVVADPCERAWRRRLHSAWRLPSLSVPGGPGRQTSTSPTARARTSCRSSM